MGPYFIDRTFPVYKGITFKLVESSLNIRVPL